MNVANVASETEIKSFSLQIDAIAFTFVCLSVALEQLTPNANDSRQTTTNTAMPSAVRSNEICLWTPFSTAKMNWINQRSMPNGIPLANGQTVPLENKLIFIWNFATNRRSIVGVMWILSFWDFAQLWFVVDIAGHCPFNCLDDDGWATNSIVSRAFESREMFHFWKWTERKIHHVHFTLSRANWTTTDSQQRNFVQNPDAIGTFSELPHRRHPTFP